jgi:hypothetical protein
MRSVAIAVIIALGAMPGMATAQRSRGGGGGGSQSAPPTRPASSHEGGGFNFSNDVPSNRTPSPSSSGGNREQAGKSGNGFNFSNDAPSARTPSAANRTGNTNVGNRTGNTNVNNRTSNTNVNNRSGNTNVNVSGNTINVNRNTYGYNGRVVANPVYGGPAWGWNHGVAWAPAPAYWGGGFWGAFAVGAATAVVMGSIINSANQQKYTSYQVTQGSPGAQLLQNYHLQQVPCGPPNLVVIYGPNNGVICANPNNLVSAGNYAVNVDTLTLQAP